MDLAVCVFLPGWLVQLDSCFVCSFPGFSDIYFDERKYLTIEGSRTIKGINQNPGNTETWKALKIKLGSLRELKMGWIGLLIIKHVIC